MRLAAALSLVAAVPLLSGIAGCTRYHVPSSSMEPTLHCDRRTGAPGCLGNGDDGLEVIKIKRFERGDIAVFRTPPAARTKCGTGGVFVKRVIGLGGETVSERKGIVFVGGRRLPEPYVTPQRRDDLSGAWHVPRGDFFLLGDNRASSCDSRYWGPVSTRNMIGKVVVIDRGSKRIRVR
jgi:signal peptidase I